MSLRLVHDAVGVSALREGARGVGYVMVWPPVTAAVGPAGSLLWSQLYYQARRPGQESLVLVVTLDALAVATGLTLGAVRGAVSRLRTAGLLETRRTGGGLEVRLVPSEFAALTRRQYGPVAIAETSNPSAETSNPSAETSDRSATTDGDHMEKPGLQKIISTETPLPPGGTGPIGQVDPFGAIPEPDRSMLEAWCAEHQARVAVSARRGPGSGRGWFGDDGLITLQRDLAQLYHDAPAAMRSVLPRFWASWDEASRGRSRGVRRQMRHLRHMLTDAGVPAPVDQLLPLLDDLEL